MFFLAVAKAFSLSHLSGVQVSISDNIGALIPDDDVLKFVLKTFGEKESFYLQFEFGELSKNVEMVTSDVSSKQCFQPTLTDFDYTAVLCIFLGYRKCFHPKWWW